MEGIITADQKIHIGADEKTGNMRSLYRDIWSTSDGKEVKIPVLRANSIRGILRRLIFKDFFDQIEYEIDFSKKTGRKLYHTFFAGGMYESSDSGGLKIDFDLTRKVQSLIPPVRLLGCAIGSQPFTSKLEIESGIPICREAVEVGAIPEWVVEKYSAFANVRLRRLLSWTYQTRRDDLRAEREEGEQAIQMKIEYEVFNRGVKFYQYFSVLDPTLWIYLV